MDAPLPVPTLSDDLVTLRPHREDDLGQLGLVEADYAWITQQVMGIAKQYAKGRIVSCLEGGYNLSALGRSVVAHVRVLAGID